MPLLLQDNGEIGLMIKLIDTCMLLQLLNLVDSTNLLILMLFTVQKLVPVSLEPVLELIMMLLIILLKLVNLQALLKTLFSITDLMNNLLLVITGLFNHLLTVLLMFTISGFTVDKLQFLTLEMYYTPEISLLMEP